MERPRQASARTAACSGSPCVVRSPARRTRSACSATTAKAWVIRSRSGSEQWMSPAAAMRTVAATGLVYHRRRASQTVERVHARPVAYSTPDEFAHLIEAMKAAAAALRDADVPYLLGGGLAAWARGGPPTEHDVDFFVRPEDAERGLAALVEAGMRPDRPPEGWLLKAWYEDTLVDLIFDPAGGPITDEHFERAERLEVM